MKGKQQWKEKLIIGLCASCFGFSATRKARKLLGFWEYLEGTTGSVVKDMAGKEWKFNALTQDAFGAVKECGVKTWKERVPSVIVTP